MIKTKRVYDPIALEDGHRFLVDSLWPRGLKREALSAEDWLKEVAPSEALRKWFAHDPPKWDEFCRRYFVELDGKPESWQVILNTARQGQVTLLYAARDEQYNNANALKLYLDARLSSQ